MAKDAGRPLLTLVNPVSTIVSPPRQLGPHGTNLWNGILSEFDVRDRAGLELLAQAAASVGTLSQRYRGFL